MADELIITITDVRRAGICTRGARRWFEGNGFDFRQFVADGMPASELLETGDAYAERVVALRCRRG